MLARARAIGFVLTLGIAVSACGGEDKAPEGPVAAEKVCEGVISGQAAISALETVRGSKNVRPTYDPFLKDAVKTIEDAHKEGVRWSTGSGCDIQAAERTTATTDLRASFYAPWDDDSGASPAEQYPYDLGKRANAGFRGASLYYECVSPRLKGSAQRPGRVKIGLSNTLPFPKDTLAVREANLVIVHSVGLTLARELKCENDGGLPAVPHLEPIK
jgi:hypothetical protein